MKDGNLRFLSCSCLNRVSATELQRRRRLHLPFLVRFHRPSMGAGGRGSSVVSAEPAEAVWVIKWVRAQMPQILNVLTEIQIFMLFLHLLYFKKKKKKFHALSQMIQLVGATLYTKELQVQFSVRECTGGNP